MSLEYVLLKFRYDANVYSVLNFDIDVRRCSGIETF
jgi:hypothetical protein